MGSKYQEATLSREVNAVAIPYGTPVTLDAESRVVITQTLGGNYTVMNEFGQMMRIEARDADALGIEVDEAALPASVDDTSIPLEDRIWAQLKTCYDPEIPVNIVELGLIYRCDVKPLPPESNRIEVDMTLTAPGCGMGSWLKYDIEQKLTELPDVGEVFVELVFDPPWSPEHMSEAARLELGMG